jgi:hypothetical protein
LDLWNCQGEEYGPSMQLSCFYLIDRLFLSVFRIELMNCYVVSTLKIALFCKN